MSAELETMGAASAGALSQETKADLSGQPCRNCGAEVEARFCPNCGQLAASFHRPIWTLIGETVSDMFALDGRLARTLPTLMFRPGRLTQQYTEGKRARFVPPFRMFLLASLVFYLLLFTMLAHQEWRQGNLKLNGEALQNTELTEAQREKLAAALEMRAGELDRAAVQDAIREIDPTAENTDDIAENVTELAANLDLFFAELEKWAPRISVLIVPMTILALMILHFWRRDLYVYDHAIHALHLHSWMYLSASLAILLVPLAGSGVFLWLLAISLVYVLISLRVAARASWVLAVVRLVVLLVFWIIVVSSLALGAIIVSGLAVSR